VSDQPHTHHDYETELDALKGVLAEMGGLAERQLRDGLRALVTRDAELGDQVCSRDHQINDLELRVDERVTKIIARRQPAGSDLRLLVAAIRTGTDLERIGDEAGKLGRFAIEFGHGQALDPQLVRAMERLGERVRPVLAQALDAFARTDAPAATALMRDIDAIAQVHDAAVRELMTYMLEDPRTIQRVLHALWCARALERISDHARNICESVVYVGEGRDIRHRDQGFE